MMAAIAICRFGNATGDPADIFTSPAPVIGSDPPKAEDIKDGDTSVATQTGAAQYNFPIRVPPGRNGMAPALSLSYSSQAPIYGSNLGAGWALNIPRIEEDVSRGRLRTHHPRTELQQGLDATADDRFVSSLAGGRGLIEVFTDPTAPNVHRYYRAQSDSTFARYQRMHASEQFRWRVLQTDGSTMLFGEASKTPGCPVSDHFAPLTSHVDVFGNEVSYEYVYLYGECMLQRITWGQNSVAGLPKFAELNLQFKRARVCPNTGIEVGSQRRYITAPPGWEDPPGDLATSVLLVTGANRIDAFEINALEPGSSTKVHTRLITVRYSEADEVCAPSSGPLTHAPIRLVTSIQESAWGTDSPRVDLPASTFTYGPTMVSLVDPNPGGQATPWLTIGAGDGKNLAWGFRRNDDRWPTVEAMTIDIDGDGLPDRLTNATVTASGVTSCKAQWQPNELTSSNWPAPRLLTFGDNGSTNMPRLRWQGPNETTQIPNPGSTQADPSDNFDHKEGCALNGQVTAFHNSRPVNGVCHDGTACTPGHYCADGNACPDGTVPNPRTYLAYRWMDMDGDQLVDLVAAVHGSNQRYDIIRGNEVVGGIQPYEPALFGTVPIPGGFPACTNLPDTCKKLGSDCMNRVRTLNTCGVNTFCEMYWPDLDACVTAAPEHSCESEIGLRVAGASDANTPPNEPGTMAAARRPYAMCGRYPWFIFKNRGSGNFADTPIIKYQPIPLESDTGDSALMGPSITATRQGVLDVDGDGLVDGVIQDRDGNNNGNSWWWSVWPNDGTGGFGPTQYYWPARQHPFGHIGGFESHAVDVAGSAMGLFDVNGDGLVDHWHANTEPQPTPGTANIALNDGTRFRLRGPIPFGDISAGEVEATIKPGSESRGYALDVQTANGQTTVLAGSRYAQLRPFDIDADGRTDMFFKSSVAAQPELRFNVGGNFATASPLPFPVYGVEQTMLATAGENGNPATWEVKTDLVDLDDDGYVEGVYWIDGVMHRASHDVATTGPLRLLKSVDNGRGAVTTIAYASMHSSSTTDPVVEQNPDELWAPGRPKASPRNQWVVRSIETDDAFSGTKAVTSYRYKNPRFNADDEGRYGLRGFEEVRTIAPSGMITKQRYSYDPDWSGRLASTVVIPAEAPNEVRSIDRTVWEARTLSGTSVVTYHATVTEHFTCSNGQSEATCAPPGAMPAGAAYTRTESTLMEFPIAGNKLLWQETGSVLRKQVGSADGDRETIRTFDLLADDIRYRFRPRTVTRNHRVNGTMTMFAKSEQTWDPELRVNLTNKVWFDDNEQNAAISRTVYDTATGNVLERWKPVQNEANTVRTTLAYDSRKLFVATETNELGHKMDYLWEYGTGSKLQTDGPDVRTCTSCPPPSPTHPLKERIKIRVDGLGRTIETWETSSDDGSQFVLYQRDQTSFVDAVSFPNTPASSTHRVRLATGVNSTWTSVKTELDGLGRPLRRIELVQGTAPADAITNYTYRHDGTLATVRVPDPSQNNSSQVEYLYTFDSLGRATSTRRPDKIALISRSGVDVAYDGVTKTVTEYVGGAGGNAASTKTITDAFGRLIEVHEKVSASPATWAVTRYTFGPDDNVVRVVDPEGVTTDLTHDFAGHRTRIDRHGRTWKYSYDKNGNMIAEQVPGATSEFTALEFTTSTVYDALDRPLSRLIGQRGLSGPDQQSFATHTEKFTWDGAGNGTGLLRSWETRAPNASSPLVKRSFVYNDDEIGLKKTLALLNLQGLTISRSTLTKVNLAKLPTETRYYEPVSPSNHTTYATISYDARNLPSRITFNNVNSGEALQAIGIQTRNVAGLVTKRRTVPPSGPMTFVESNWQYDTLGRITSQLVQRGPGPVEVARQELKYLGNDNVSSMEHSLGGTAKVFDFGYDLRHQLTSAEEATTPGYFSSTYSYGLAGRFTKAKLEQSRSTPGSELKSRHVDYAYKDSDPERLSVLRFAGSETPYATYTYDEAGNQTSRCYGEVTSPCNGELLELVYDGKDQLRRATKKVAGVVQGSEEYWYDHDGQRVAIVRRDASGAKIETIAFVGDVEAHYDANNALDFNYSHLSLGTPIARVKRTSAGYELEYQFHGLANHTLATVSTIGVTNAAFSYSPFGEVLETIDDGGASGTTDHRRRFNDKYHDVISDLSYYGARYFDRFSISWTQSDPLYKFSPEEGVAVPRRASLYMFSLNAPLRYLDPDGRDPQMAAVNRAIDNALLQHGTPSQRYAAADRISESNFAQFKAEYEAEKSWGDKHPVASQTLETMGWVAVGAFTVAEFPATATGLAIGAALNLSGDSTKSTPERHSLKGTPGHENMESASGLGDSLDALSNPGGAGPVAGSMGGSMGGGGGNRRRGNGGGGGGGGNNWRCEAPGCSQSGLFRNGPDHPTAPNQRRCRNHYCQDNEGNNPRRPQDSNYPIDGDPKPE